MTAPCTALRASAELLASLAVRDDRSHPATLTVRENGIVHLWDSEVHSSMSLEELWDTRPRWAQQVIETFVALEQHDLLVHRFSVEKEGDGFQVVVFPEAGYWFTDHRTREVRRRESSGPCYECGKVVRRWEDPSTQHVQGCPVLQVTEVMEG